ncbi:uncharacterized protein LOC116292398 [Actinia tenebrosa]|uniref:Uncharacterized protein LOC116292398 n=1 Tax=Actinia tenebrosa TaxID=6105 RepID=A0A6P8HS97_ACTTE|nr:uncharacterized protein LOC116292398 [Actinia tenebrosa]
MALSVRSSRCAAISMIIFGLLIFVPAGFFIAFSIIYKNQTLHYRWLKGKAPSTLDLSLMFWWNLGYTSLLALITMITGCIGCCASGHRAHRDMCQIVTLFIFSLMVAGLSAYAIYDFSTIISTLRLLIKINGDTCKNNGSCNVVFVAIGSSLLGLAILVFLLSSWAIICCLASFCCHTEVEPEPLPARQQMMGGQQGVMMQGTAMVPMMRADTMHFMAQPNPVMVQAVPVMPSSQQVHVAPVNQEFQQQSQATPMQMVAIPVVRNDETIA